MAEISILFNHIFDCGHSVNSQDRQPREQHSAPFAVTDIHGLEKSDGEKAFPGLSNSFLIFSRWNWIYKYREVWMPILLFSLLVAFIVVSNALPRFFGESDFSEVPLLEFGSIPPRAKKIERVKQEVDEVFGNEYVKKEEKKTEVSKDQEGSEDGEGDFNASGAVDLAFMPGIRPPSPVGRLKKVYPDIARSEDVEAQVMTELLIAASGRVVKVNVIGVRLSKELPPEKVSEMKRAFAVAANQTFRGAQFSRTIVNGKSVPIRMEIPLNFTLSGQ